MRTNRNSLKGYKIDYATNTIKMNYSFAKKAQDYGSPEYVLLQNIKADFPMMTIVVESGRKVDKAMYNKRLSYKNIEEHIKGYTNADELLESFELAKRLSKPLASPYKYVCDWFRSQFPDYKNVMLSVKNCGVYVEPVEMPNLNNYKFKDDYVA